MEEQLSYAKEILGKCIQVLEELEVARVGERQCLPQSELLHLVWKEPLPEEVWMEWATIEDTLYHAGYILPCDHEQNHKGWSISEHALVPRRTRDEARE